MHLKYESQVREALVDGNKTYSQVTEDICAPVEKAPSKLWYIGFYLSLACLSFGAFSVGWEVYWGTGVWNLNKTIGWGWDMVGWYRSRRNFDFCNLITFPSRMANWCKPRCRSDDDFRRNVCGSIPDFPYGTCMDGILYITLS
jgi:hypothetical protein